MTDPSDDLQTTQRLRVGMIGLVAVVLLIALAGWIIGSADHATANGTVEIAVGNVTGGNAATGEPLAELGATPGTLNDQVADAR